MHDCIYKLKRREIRKKRHGCRNRLMIQWDKGAPGGYKILTTSEGLYRSARFSPEIRVFSSLRLVIDFRVAYECAIGIYPWKTETSKEKEREKDATTVVSLRESRIAILIIVRMCNARRKVSTRYKSAADAQNRFCTIKSWVKKAIADKWEKKENSFLILSSLSSHFFNINRGDHWGDFCTRVR